MYKALLCPCMSVHSSLASSNNVPGGKVVLTHINDHIKCHNSSALHV